MFIADYTEKFHLRWLLRYLFSKIGFGQIERWIGGPEKNTQFCPECEFSEGWYMLEARVNLKNIRAKAKLSCNTGPSENGATSLNLDLYSGRLCKRLIYIKKSTNCLSFEIDIADDIFEMQNFRLVMITRNFAFTRLITKLQAIHPRYKNGIRQINSLEMKGHLTTLWHDYCQLFDEEAEFFTYTDWIEEFDNASNNLIEKYREDVKCFDINPLISIVLIVKNPEINLLNSTISSVCEQIYNNWELCIIDSASTDPEVRLLLERYSLKNERIKAVFITESSDTSCLYSDITSLTRGSWVLLLKQEDLLAKQALYWAVSAINEYPDCRLIYSDEDKVDNQGVRSDPNFKCKWNIDLFYSQNNLSHFCLYQKELIKLACKLSGSFKKLNRQNLTLHCIEIISPTEIHHIPRLLYHSRIQKNKNNHLHERHFPDSNTGENALNEHFGRIGLPAKAIFLGNGFRIQYNIPDSIPLVSLIIPTRNGLNFLKKCINSIIEKTSYKNYEIILVDNGSDDISTLKYISWLQKNYDIQVIRDGRPFNYSALNNAAVKLAKGELVALINNDIEVITPDWLSEMVSHAVRPEVGAVGAKLLYSDDTIQHAGVILGIHGIAEHVHRFLPRASDGYCGRANLIQSFSAVTAACLVVRKSLYEAVGGLNEVELKVACNDVDFCLRLREAGYRNIWTPYAELYHHESVSRGFDDTPEKRARSAKEIAYMQKRWGDALLNDPAYNPNLSLDAHDFSLAWPPRLPEFN